MLLLKVYLPGCKWMRSGCVAPPKESLCVADATARPVSGFSPPERAATLEDRLTVCLSS